jgi:glutathione transport system substrate-binding protein
VKFHDGTDFNAAAVKANFDRVTDPANKLKRYGLFRVIAKTEVVDPLTVRFTLQGAVLAFINVLAHPSAVMISPAALKKYGATCRCIRSAPGRSSSSSGSRPTT